MRHIIINIIATAGVRRSVLQCLSIHCTPIYTTALLPVRSHVTPLCPSAIQEEISVIYITQSVPRSKHSVSVIQTSQLMLYREIIAVCSEIHTKHINTLCGQGRI